MYQHHFDLDTIQFSKASPQSSSLNSSWYRPLLAPCYTRWWASGWELIWWPGSRFCGG